MEKGFNPSKLGLLCFFCFWICRLCPGQEFRPISEPNQADSLLLKKIKKPKLKSKPTFFQNSQLEISHFQTHRNGKNDFAIPLQYTQFTGQSSVWLGNFPLKIQFAYTISSNQIPVPQFFFNVSPDEALLEKSKLEKAKQRLKENREKLYTKYGKKEVLMAIELEDSGLGTTNPVVPDKGEFKKPSLEMPNPDLNPAKVGQGTLPDGMPDINKVIPDSVKKPEIPTLPKINQDSVGAALPDHNSPKPGTFPRTKPEKSFGDSLPKRKTDYAYYFKGREGETAKLIERLDSLKAENPDFENDIKQYKRYEKLNDSIMKIQDGPGKPKFKVGTFFTHWSDQSVFQTPLSGVELKMNIGKFKGCISSSRSILPQFGAVQRFRPATLFDFGFNSGKIMIGIRGGHISNDLSRNTQRDTSFQRLRVFGARSIESFLTGMYGKISFKSNVALEGEFNRVASLDQKLDFETGIKHLVASRTFLNNPILVTGNAQALGLVFKPAKTEFKFKYSRVGKFFINAGNPFLRNNWEGFTLSSKWSLFKNRLLLEPFAEIGKRLEDERTNPEPDHFVFFGARLGYYSTNAGFSGSITRPQITSDSGGRDKNILIQCQGWLNHEWNNLLAKHIFSFRKGERSLIRDTLNSRIQSMEIGLQTQWQKGESIFTMDFQYREDQFTPLIQLKVLQCKQLLEKRSGSFLLSGQTGQNFYFSRGLGIMLGGSIEKKIAQSMTLGFNITHWNSRGIPDSFGLSGSETQYFLKLIWRK